MSGRPLDALTTALRHLHRGAGEPSTRDVGRAINFSHTTVAHALKGSRRPSWPVVEQIVLYLKGDVDEFRRLWIAVRNSERPLPPKEDEAPDRDLGVGTAGIDHRTLTTPTGHTRDAQVIAIWNPKSRSLEFILSAEVALAWIKDLSKREGPE